MPGGPTWPGREARWDRTEVSRGRSTGRDVQVGPGRAERQVEWIEAVLLVLVTVIAVIPRGAGLLWEGTVHSVEYCGRA